MAGLIAANRVFIIAEAGVNHNGSLATALKLVDMAAKAGADAVKFQTWKTKNVMTRHAPKAAYQRTTTPAGSAFDMLKQLELPYRSFRRIHQHCRSRGIMFLSTADEIESARFLNRLQPVFKVGSAELKDLPFLERLASFGKPLILSTGLGTLPDIQKAVATVLAAGLTRDQLTILHCNTAYPTPFEDVNLRAMLTIGRRLRIAVGYSDHTLGIAIPIAAVALGARVIEKHFTLSRRMPGPDHRMSLESHELTQMVRSIRQVEAAMGDGRKRVSPSEAENAASVGKSIVARRQIRKGATFTESNLTIKRPGGGLPPDQWPSVLGRVARRSFRPDEFIER